MKNPFTGKEMYGIPFVPDGWLRGAWAGVHPQSAPEPALKGSVSKTDRSSWLWIILAGAALAWATTKKGK